MALPQLRKVSVSPGVNSQLTQTANSTSWWKSNLVQWRDGLLERISGWQRLVDETASGLIRAMHAYQDLSLTNNLLLGTDGGAQVYAGSGIYSFIYAIKSVFATSITVGGIGVTAATVTTSFDHDASPGDSTTTRTLMTLGGRRYNPGTTFAIATTPTGTTFTTTLPAATLTAAAASMISFTHPYGGSVGTFNVVISLTAHGYSPGDTIPISFSLNYVTADFIAVISAGDYIVQTVPNANTVTINTTYQVLTPGAPVGVYGYDNGIPAAVFAIPMSINAASGPGADSNWYLDNFGEIGLISATGEPIYAYQPPAGTTPVATLISTGPQINTGMFVAMPQAQIIAFGSEVLGVQDPMLVRWCDTSDYEQWTAAVGNQAGSYRLSQGSRIVGGIQAPMATLLWTDVGLWVMGYVGPPLIYSFTQIATGCGLIAPKAQVVLNSQVYWMGNRQFYVFNGNGMTSLDCTVWDFVFNDLDAANVSKCFGGANSINDEGFFFFPSASGGMGEIDSYVKFTVLGGQVIWDTGRLGRTTWLDQSVFGQALAGDLNSRIQQHNTGYDADGEPITGAYIESGGLSIADGDQIPRVNEIVPDMKWFGDVPGAIAVTLKGWMYPQDNFFTKGPYGMDQANKHIRPRMRARFLAFRIEWIPRMGQTSRIGSWFIRMRERGRKP